MPTFDQLTRMYPTLAATTAGKASLRQMATKEAGAINPYDQMSDAERASLLQTMAGYGGNMLQGAFGIADLGHNAVMSSLAGEPENAFTNPISLEGRRDGRYVLEKWGLAPKNEPGLDRYDIAGFAMDVVLDPLNLVSLGGAGVVTSSGKALALNMARKSAKELIEKGTTEGIEKAIGKTAMMAAKSKTEMIDKVAGKLYKQSLHDIGTRVTAAGKQEALAKGERALIGLRNPITGDAFWTAGTGEGAAAFHKAMHYGKYSPVRPVRKFLDSKVHGAWDGKMQRAWDQVYEDGMKRQAYKGAATRQLGKELNSDMEKMLDSMGQPQTVEQVTELSKAHEAYVRRMVEESSDQDVVSHLNRQMFFHGGVDARSMDPFKDGRFHSSLAVDSAKARATKTGKSIGEELYIPAVDVTKKTDRSITLPKLFSEKRIDAAMMRDDAGWHLGGSNVPLSMEEQAAKYAITAAREEGTDKFWVTFPGLGEDGAPVIIDNTFKSKAAAEEFLFTQALRDGVIDPGKVSAEELFGGIAGGGLVDGIKRIIEQGDAVANVLKKNRGNMRPAGAFRETILDLKGFIFGHLSDEDVLQYGEHLGRSGLTKADMTDEMLTVYANDLFATLQGNGAAEATAGFITSGVEAIDLVANNAKKFLDVDIVKSGGAYESLLKMMGEGNAYINSFGSGSRKQHVIQKAIYEKTQQGQYDSAWDAIRQHQDVAYDGLNQWGYGGPEMSDLFARHSFRSAAGKSSLDDMGRSLSDSPLNVHTFDATVDARDPLYKNIPGGTGALNRMSIDPRIAGKGRTIESASEATKYIATEYGVPIEQAKGLAKKFAGRRQEDVAARVPLFHRQAIVDAQHSLAHMADLEQNFKSFGAAAQMGKREGLIRKAGEEGYDTAVHTKSVAEYWTGAKDQGNLGIDARGLRKFLGPEGLDVLGEIGQDITAKADEEILPELQKLASQYFISPEYADQMKKTLVIMKDKKNLNEYSAFMNRLRKVYSQYLTVPFPAFWTRNSAEGGIANILEMDSVADYPLLMGGYKAAHKALKGTGSATHYDRVEEMMDLGIWNKFGGRADELFNDAVGRESFALDRTGIEAGQFAAKPLEGIRYRGLHDDPLDSSRWWKASGTRAVESMKASYRKSVSGLGDEFVQEALPQRSKFFLARFGENMSERIEFYNRFALYDALRNKGYSIQAAGKKVKLAHFDYSELSDFEKSVLRPSMLFYTWQRKNIPRVMRNIAEHPGGPITKLVRTQNQIQGAVTDDETGYIPTWLKEGVSIPLPDDIKLGDVSLNIGDKDPGTTRYLRFTGLPWEDPSRITPTDPTRMWQYVVNNLNPVLRYPFEKASGTVMRTGQPINDVYGPVKSLSPDLYHLFQHTPLSRAASLVDKTAGVFVDKPGRPGEKFYDWWQPLMAATMPVQTVDLNMDQAIQRESQKVLGTAMGDSPNIRMGTHPYIPKGAVPTAKEQTFMEIYQSQQRDKGRRGAHAY